MARESESDASSQSPFLPGTQIQFAWDSTSLGWLKTCPRKYQYHMIEGWKSKGNSVHLDFGLWYHAALEGYDKYRAQGIHGVSLEGVDHETALRETVRDCLKWTWIDGAPWESGHNLKTRETLVRSVIWYLEQFGKDDPAETVILANGKPAVELSFRMELDFGPRTKEQKGWNYGDGPYPGSQPYLLSGHLDRLVSYSGGTYVMDRKTSTTTLGSYYFDQYEPDNQMTLYTLAAKVIYQTPVKGVIIDAMQIAVGFSRPARGFTFRTDGQLEEWLGDTKAWLRQAEAYAESGFWPMNDKSCHQYGGCIFRKVCSKDPRVRQTFLESDFIKDPWNPLKVRNA